MNTNPYASPADIKLNLIGNPLALVGGTLIAMSGVWVIACIWLIANFMYAAAHATDPGMVRFYQMNSGSMGACVVYQGFLIAGAIGMLRK